MKEIYLFKMLRDNSAFKKGQKVWASLDIGSVSGAGAVKALGRQKNKGKWTHCWISLDWKNGHQISGGTPNAKEYLVKVSDEFYKKLCDIEDEVESRYWDRFYKREKIRRQNQSGVQHRPERGSFNWLMSGNAGHSFDFVFIEERTGWQR